MRFLNKDTRFFCPKEKNCEILRQNSIEIEKILKKVVEKKSKLLFKHKHVFNKYLFAVIFLQ